MAAAARPPSNGGVRTERQNLHRAELIDARSTRHEREATMAAERLGSSSGSTPGSGGGFHGLRAQFERRRQAHFDELERAMGEVDVSFFVESQGVGQGMNLEFELCGAVPPTTSSRCVELANIVAIGKAEKQAAQDLIARSREASKTGGHKKVSAPLVCITGDDGVAAGSTGQDEADIWPTPATPKRLDSPGSPGWEQTLSNFYRQSEFKKNIAKRREKLACQEAKVHSQALKVQRYTFERKHKQREVAILSESEKIQKCMAFREFRTQGDKTVEESRRQRQEEVEEQRLENAARREQSKAKKAVFHNRRDFMLKQGMLDKTVRYVDAHNIVAKGEGERLQRARETHEGFALRSQQLASRKLLCAAEKAKRDADERERIRYLAHGQKMEKQRETEERRQRIYAQQAFDKFLRQAREEVVARREDGQAEPSREELAELLSTRAYERTLHAFRDLAQGVRLHGAKIGAMQGTLDSDALQGVFQDIEGLEERRVQDELHMQPLLASEPRIQALFAAAAAAGGHYASGSAFSRGPERSEEEGEATTELLAGLEESFLGLSEGEFTVEARGPRLALPLLPATVPPPPLSVAVAPLPSVARTLGPTPLTARAARPTSGRQQPQAAQTQALSARAATTTQGSFNALMSIRPHGPR